MKWEIWFLNQSECRQGSQLSDLLRQEAAPTHKLKRQRKEGILWLLEPQRPVGAGAAEKDQHKWYLWTWRSKENPYFSLPSTLHSLSWVPFIDWRSFYGRMSNWRVWSAAPMIQTRPGEGRGKDLRQSGTSLAYHHKNIIKTRILVR